MLSFMDIKEISRKDQPVNRHFPSEAQKDTWQGKPSQAAQVMIWGAEPFDGGSFTGHPIGGQL
jgi:hypothetical protein